jgi:hypothetical protein
MLSRVSKKYTRNRAATPKKFCGSQLRDNTPENHLGSSLLSVLCEDCTAAQYPDTLYL